MAVQIAPLLTLLHEQTWAESGMASSPPSPRPASEPTINSCGWQGSGASPLANIDSMP